MAKQRRADDHAARLKEAFSGWTIVMTGSARIRTAANNTGRDGADRHSLPVLLFWMLLFWIWLVAILLYSKTRVDSVLL
jgi:hypothetical protein